MSFIGIDIAGDAALKDKFGKLPEAVEDNGVEIANDYILNVERIYAPSHKGEPFLWQSDAQRRAAFAKMREMGNGPPYSRTQTLARGWHVLGSGKNQIIVNEVPYAKFVKDPPIPGHAAREWKSIAQDMKEKAGRIVEKFAEGVRKGIAKVGL